AISSEIGAVLLSSGNVLRAKGDLIRDRALQSINFDYLPWKYQNLEELPKKTQCYYANAEEKYEEAIATPSVSRETKVKAQINLFKLRIEAGKTSGLKNLYQGIEIEKLSPSRSSVYDKIYLAESWAYWQQREENANDFTESFEQLNSALQEAQELGDKRAESYVLGNLGGLYEYLAWQGESAQSKEDETTALEVTQKALDLIQPLASPDLAYQWEWQIGRLRVRQNQPQKAISHYRIAARSLDLVRNNLLAINTDIQFSFRDNVEPLYRQLLGLMLARPESDNLQEALYYLESLQLAELENFLRCDLQTDFQRQQSPFDSSTETISEQRENLVEKDSTTAFVYPIILSDRLDTIWKLPGESLKHYSRTIPASEIEETLRSLRQGILDRYPTEFRKNAQKVYEWLIEPVEDKLKHHSIKTLGFILDGSFRQIPISALYDRKANKYLVEKDYAIAIIPSVQLIELENPREGAKVLGGGISKGLDDVEGRNFAPLQAEKELNIVADEILLDSSFTLEMLQHKVDSGNFSVVHLATHGKFSSDPEETYILVHSSEASRGRLLKAKEFDTLLRNRDREDRIELLVLSACETAQGDNRAILGLAGLAVRSGVESTLATLWRVSDDSTVDAMKVFYQELQDGATKAEALHRAQQSLLQQQRYQPPYYWAPYILVGSWR
ncbi:MAG: CHAT domain-containing protein, partial [Cyanobacteriota bacterium]|nr:CHAT domain-containing protein [Cyanobacteriota bacterium]